LNFGFLENNIATGKVNGQYYPLTNAQSPATYSSATDPREWFFIFGTQYDAVTPDPLLTVNVLNTATPMLYFWTALRNGTAWADKSYILHSYKPNTAADKFAFSSKGLLYSASAAKADIAQVNVFPNPYFGLNTKEANKYNKFVTFNHLPPKATLSIVNLSGVRIKKLVKNDTEQFLKWDLTNEAGLPVASGMYVIYVDMGSLGTKILKFAVIQELQQLDKY
jgi:hypothetical protein